MLAEDAAGVVASASTEGIYYAMVCGRFAAAASEEFCTTDNAKPLRSARRGFMKADGRVFWMLGMMPWFSYLSDKRRGKFVSICSDPDADPGRLHEQAVGPRQTARP